MVSEITPDGYLRVQRLPQRGCRRCTTCSSPRSPQKSGLRAVRRSTACSPVYRFTCSRLEATRTTQRPNPADLDAVYVDVGASSAAEVRKAGVDVLYPITLTRRLVAMNGQLLNAVSMGDRFGAAAVLESLAHLDPAKVSGTLTVAFVVQQRTGARGLQRILTTRKPTNFSTWAALLPGGPSAMEGVHHAPRREPGSGVLLANEQSEPAPARLQTQLQKLARESRRRSRRLFFRADSSKLSAASGAARENGTHRHSNRVAGYPGRNDQLARFQQLTNFSSRTKPVRPSPQRQQRIWPPLFRVSRCPNPPLRSVPRRAVERAILSDLVRAYGGSTHEDPVRERVKTLLPKWAKPETDDAGNLI